MKTGIVILNYNDYDNTIKMIESIKDYKCLDKIVIVDNASSDESVQKIRPYESDKIKLIESKTNKGYSSGNNLGLKYLDEEEYDLAIISNPDIEVSSSVIEELIKDMKNDKDIAILGPKILENGTISKGWKLPTFKTELISNINYFSRKQKELIKYPADYYVDGINKVDVVHGCFFISRLSMLKEIDYFDEETFLYYEENILGSKCKEKEFKVAVDTRLSVNHMQSVSVDKSLKKIQKYKRLKESQQYYVLNYMHIGIVRYLILRMFYYLSIFVSYIIFWM